MYRAGSSPLAVVEPLLIGSCEKVTSGASRSVVLNHRLIVIGIESLNNSFDTTPPWVRSTYEFGRFGWSNPAAVDPANGPGIPSFTLCKVAASAPLLASTRLFASVPD